MEFLQIPLFDDDFYKLIVRLVINAIFVALVVGIAYHPNQKNRIYVFTFLMMHLMVFFTCFTLKKLFDGEFGIGMALGLFAIFTIIRFRTEAVPIKEMTYLFIVIGIAVINSLSNRKTSYAELFFANSAIFAATLVLEKFSVTRRLASVNVTLSNLDLVQEGRRPELIAEIKKICGVDAVTIQIRRVDSKRGQCSLVVFYEDEFEIPGRSGSS